MKKLASFKFLVILFSSMLIMSCSNDDDDMGNFEPVDPENPTTGVNITYTLNSVAVETISGEAKFIENKDNSVTIELELINTPSGGQHPAHIHYNSAAEGGGIALTLGVVDGTTGKSSITVSALDDGTAINYDGLLAFNGYINVHLSADELGTIVAQGDIGVNQLTGVSKSYDLLEKDAPGIEGTVTFYERLNGQALSVIELMNTPENGVHPAHIHNNSSVEGGGIAFSFNPVDGTSGMSKTNIKALDDGTSFGYNDILEFDGYINVHLSADELGTIVAQGDIGVNELTGMSKSYDLLEKDAPGISGEVTFFERKSGESLALIALENTPDGGIHPAHIHDNDVATGGGIAFTFTPVNGTTGMSYTHVAQLDNGSSFLYNDIDSFMGYINVHLSAEQLNVIVAQGNIGASKDDNSEGSTVAYEVTNSGATAYIFNGEGESSGSNPDFTLKRGMTYEFEMNTPGHPFYIKTAQSTGGGDSYSDGVTNNGAESGTITFTVPMDAPDTLYYICEFHSSMTGTFNIVD